MNTYGIGGGEMFLIYRGREENITTPAIIKKQLKDSVWHNKNLNRSGRMRPI